MRKSEAARVVARARELIGTRFRAQGRDPAAGLDCVGLVAAAAGIADPPTGYALRGGSPEALAVGLRAAGFRPARAMQAGDVPAMWTGPEQLHLGIWTGDGLVHADAGLRRIVERPGAPAWPVLGIWRLRRGR
jgi:lipoprotein Spr